MKVYIATGLFLSVAIHAGALLLINQQGSSRMDAPPDAKVFIVELFSVETPIKKKPNQPLFKGKIFGEDPTEKKRPEIFDLPKKTTILPPSNKTAPVLRKDPLKSNPLFRKKSKSLPKDPSQKTETENAKLKNKKRGQSRQQTQSLENNQRFEQPEDLGSERSAAKSQMSFSKPSAVIKTRPLSLAGNLPPMYPNLARRRGIEGTVVVMAGISPSGLVSSIRIKTSSGSSTLDSAALRAVRDWRFTPATNNGSPITSEVEIPLTFKIK